MNNCLFDLYTNLILITLHVSQNTLWLYCVHHVRFRVLCTNIDNVSDSVINSKNKMMSFLNNIGVIMPKGELRTGSVVKSKQSTKSG